MKLVDQLRVRAEAREAEDRAAAQAAADEEAARWEAYAGLVLRLACGKKKRGDGAEEVDALLWELGQTPDDLEADVVWLRGVLADAARLDPAEALAEEVLAPARLAQAHADVDRLRREAEARVAVAHGRAQTAQSSASNVRAAVARVLDVVPAPVRQAYHEAARLLVTAGHRLQARLVPQAQLPRELAQRSLEDLEGEVRAATEALRAAWADAQQHAGKDLRGALAKRVRR